jgi:threonine dehydrogenase-like Zn-dependent dehydrogenase
MTTRRSTGRLRVAQALWYVAPGKAELRSAPLPAPGPEQALVRTQWSGISRGTERLVLEGAVGESEWQRMRAPLQEGDFPFPVKYGYCATGVVEAGPNELIGQRVFCLHPHQDWFIAPVAMLAPLPDDVPSRRATLAANMETALNAHWDAGTGPGDRVAVIGAGVVGLLVAYLGARLPGAEVTVYDIDPGRRPIVEAMGAAFRLSTEAGAGAGGADVVFNASVSGAGLDLGMALAGMEGTIVELSWYGDKPVTVGLGGAFHSRRLRLLSSQVGQVSASRRSRWDYRRRLTKSLQLLSIPAMDLLVAEAVPFAEAARRVPELLQRGAAGLAPVISYAE